MHYFPCIDENSDINEYNSVNALCRLSACCTHISALLHALTALCPTSFAPRGEESSADENKAAVPMTSLACQCKPPRKRESSAKIADVYFEKHVYGRAKKPVLRRLEDFDPRPEKSSSSNMPTLLDSVRGQGLCVSLLLDPRTRHWSQDQSCGTTGTPNLPDDSSLRHTIGEFKKSLEVTEELHCQRDDWPKRLVSLVWFAVRHYRITASRFGEIMRRRASTAPDSLVLQILQPRQFSSVATDWGICNEAAAIDKYRTHKTHYWTHWSNSVSGGVRNQHLTFLLWSYPRRSCV